uniref:Uncharacterized protein n=1 Tax=Arundo donax TaxID=35708 RepID=A0A0A9DMW2_ARUDO
MKVPMTVVEGNLCHCNSVLPFERCSILLSKKIVMV